MSHATAEATLPARVTPRTSAADEQIAASRRDGVPLAAALSAGVVTVVLVLLASLAVGPAHIGVGEALRAVTGLGRVAPERAAIVRQLRLPRAVLGLLVGGVLAMCGGAYQGAFRNPLADPYLLGVAAGGGLGATLAIVAHLPHGLVPASAFAGSLAAVALTLAVGAAAGRTASTLILAGVSVSSLFAAAQTFVQQRHADDLRAVYTWLLGRLSTAGWSDVRTLAPYALVCAAVLAVGGRALDVLAVGDDEARTLGVHARRTRLLVVLAASLGTAAAVAVSGLIAFVGIIVPHTVRLLTGAGHRALLLTSFVFGGAFLAGADLLARSVVAPAELPIGVVTAFFGAPFLLVALRRRATP